MVGRATGALLDRGTRPSPKPPGYGCRAASGRVWSAGAPVPRADDPVLPATPPRRPQQRTTFGTKRTVGWDLPLRGDGRGRQCAGERAPKDPVALAGGRLQARPVDEVDAAAPVREQAGLPERTQRHGDRGAAHA